MLKEMVMSSELTGQALKLLNAVRDLGTWVNRAQIATAINKNRLTPYDIELLELLVNEGLIDIRQHERPGAIPYEFQYRAK